MRHVLHALSAIALAAPAMPAIAAEPFLDVFAGRSIPQRTDIRLTADRARIEGQIVPAALRVDLDRVKPSRSPVYGARIGLWFGDIGIALDAATISPDIRAQTITGTATLAFDEDVFGDRVVIDPGQNASVAIPRIGVPTTVTVAGLAMARLPIGRSAAAPHGRVAPYAFAGPVWLVTDTSLDGKIGLRAGGGLRVPVWRNVALFGEYRYTHVDNAEADAGRIGGSVRGIEGSTGRILARFDLRNHSAVGGLSIGF